MYTKEDINYVFLIHKSDIDYSYTDFPTKSEFKPWVTIFNHVLFDLRKSNYMINNSFEFNSFVNKENILFLLLSKMYLEFLYKQKTENIL